MNIIIKILVILPFFSFAQVNDSILMDLYELQPYSTYNKQCYNSNKQDYILTGAFVFLGGALNGVAEDLQFHYGEFKNTFPNANDDFWNPKTSWKRKYKNVDEGDYRERYPLSTTALAWTTDGYHLVRTSQRLMFTTALVLDYDKRKNWKQYLIDAGIYTIIRSLGFHFTYSFGIN